MFHVRLHVNKLIKGWDEKKTPALQKQSNTLPLWKSLSKKWATGMFDLPQSVYARMEKVKSAEFGSTKEDELPGLYAHVCKAWENKKTALRNVWRYVQPSASFRLFKTIGSHMAMPQMPYEASYGD